MPELDVCLEMVFVSLPTEERIKKIAEAGYKSVEFWFHDSTFDGDGCNVEMAKDAAALKQICEETEVSINNMVVNAPDGSFGGSPVDANDLNKYLERLEEVIEFSKACGTDMAITCTGNLIPGLSREQMRANLVKAYGKAAEIAEARNFRLVLEPLNTYVDHEGYYLDSSCEGAAIVREINSPAFKLLYDVYHMQIMEGNIISHINKHIDVIGHFHSAGVPGRHEHFDTEINYPAVIKAVDATAYKGRFGLEYSPKMEDNLESLIKVRQYLS